MAVCTGSYNSLETKLTHMAQDIGNRNLCEDGSKDFFH